MYLAKNMHFCDLTNYLTPIASVHVNPYGAVCSIFSASIRVVRCGECVITCSTHGDRNSIARNKDTNTSAFWRDVAWCFVVWRGRKSSCVV